MDDEAGVFMLIVSILGGLVVVLGGLAGLLYVVDAPIEAIVVDKDCGFGPLGSSSTVTVRTVMPIPGVEHTVTQVDNGVCGGLRSGDDGNFVEYHIRSGRTVLYEYEGGGCLYDSHSILC